MRCGARWYPVLPTLLQGVADYAYLAGIRMIDPCCRIHWRARYRLALYAAEAAQTMNSEMALYACPALSRFWHASWRAFSRSLRSSSPMLPRRYAASGHPCAHTSLRVRLPGVRHRGEDKLVASGE